MTLQELGISREDILDKAAEKLLESYHDGSDLIADLRYQAKTTLLAEAKPKIDEILKAAIEDLVDMPFTPMDEWGQPKRGEATSLRELIKEKAMQFLQERVGNDGKPASYGSVCSRGEWYAKKAAQESIDYGIKKEISEAVDKAKGEVKRLVAAHITEMLLKK